MNKLLIIAKNFFAKLFNKQTQKDAVTFGTKVANDIKSVADSPLLDVIVNLTPTDLDNNLLPQFRSIMARFVEAMNLASVVLNTVADEDAYASILHDLNAKAEKTKAFLVGGEQINIQQALTIPQLAFNADAVIKSA